MGYGSGQTVLFIKGKYYVKIASFKPGPGAMELAREVSTKMGDHKTDLPQFTRFPIEGALADGRGFVKSDYMGLDFLNDVYEQRYQREGMDFTAFLLTPKESLDKFMERAMSTVESMGAKADSFTVGDFKGLRVSDPYEGTWSLINTGSGFMGVKGIENKERLTKFLEELIIRNEKS